MDPTTTFHFKQVVATLLALEALCEHDPVLPNDLRNFFNQPELSPEAWQELRSGQVEFFSPPPEPHPAKEPAALPTNSEAAVSASLTNAESPAPAAATDGEPPASSVLTDEDNVIELVPFPFDEAGLRALVNAATPDQLAALYKAGPRLADLVNQRWHADSQKRS